MSLGREGCIENLKIEVRTSQTLLENIIFSIAFKTVHLGYFCAKGRKLKRLLAGEMKLLRPVARFMLTNKAIYNIGP